MEIAVIKSYNWVVCKKNYLMCAWFELPGESRFIFLMFIWYTQQVVYIYKFENIFPQSVEYRCAIFCNNPLNYQRIEFKFRSIISSDFARIMLIIFNSFQKLLIYLSLQTKKKNASIWLFFEHNCTFFRFTISIFQELASSCLERHWEKWDGLGDEFLINL